MRDGTGAYDTVLLLGGSSEIALAIVGALPLRPDARVVGAGRRPAPDEVGVRVEHAAWEASEPVPDDLWFGGRDVDLVVLAVGVLGDQAAAEAAPEGARSVSATNFTDLVPALLTVANTLERQGHGSIVVLSTVAGVRTRRANFVYGASKAGLDAFALGLGDRLAGTGVDLLVVRPGFVRSRMTEGMPDAPFATTPEHVAKAVAGRLAAHPNGVLWVPAILQPVFLVLRALPRRVFRRLPG